VWATAVFVVFRPMFRDLDTFGHAREYGAIIVSLIVVFSIFVLFVLPVLPNAVWSRSETPVEFFWANSWYFLPKSIEILFQQILIATLILALATLKLNLRTISGTVALLFGGFHLTLALSYPNPVYVARYVIAATCFGALAPWLILRVRNGFFWSYAIHWLFYAVDITIIHFVFAA
jgi:hypothetical protein